MKFKTAVFRTLLVVSLLVPAGACSDDDDDVQNDASPPVDSAGMDGSGPSDAQSDAEVGPTCVPEGLETPEADVSPVGFSLYTSIALPAPGTSDPPDHTNSPQVRIGLTPDDPSTFPDPTELSVTMNGCPILKSTGPGEEFFWVSRDEEVTVAPQAGRYVTIEVRHGTDVLMRLSHQNPAVMPEITAPASGATIVASPTQISWNVLGLAAMGLLDSELRITAWVAVTPIHTDGSAVLTDADGTYLWNEGSSAWTHLALKARIRWTDDGFEVNYYYMIPVNS